MYLSKKNLIRLIAAVLLISVMFAAVRYLPDLDPDMVGTAIDRFGPVAVVLLVALGIVVSPIPSGAIALVAGAVYGTWFGGALTILGAGLGASGAFAISRVLGRDVISASSSSAARFLTRARSQRGLMLCVFLTRLVPFVSFDAVSYLAGLTPLTFWRFLVATLAGTTPTCLAFAAAGHAQVGADQPTAILIVACGITLLAPAIVLLTRTKGVVSRAKGAMGWRAAWRGLNFG